MTHLVYFACPGMPDGRTADAYERALAPLGDVELHWVCQPGPSAAFVGEAARLRRGGRIVPGLLDAYMPRRPHATLSLIGFSAGCWLSREICRNADDRAAIDAIVELDGVHDSSKTVDARTDYELGPYLAYAERAKAGEALFWIGHTDVQTVGYASTTVAAKRLLAACPAGGDFYVRPYNLFDDRHQKQEHGAALTSWGPSFVAEALVPYLRRKAKQPELDEGVPPWHDTRFTLSERAIAWSGFEMGRGNLETRGANDGPRIEEYFRPARRRINGIERPLGLRKGYWCAVGLHAAELAARLPGDPPPLPYRAAGWESQRDAAELGLWRPVEVVRRGLWKPSPGDGVVLHRGPRESWPTSSERHLCRYTGTLDPEHFVTMDANHGNRWSDVARMFRDEEIIGFVDLHKRDTGSALLEACAALTDDVTAGRVPMEAALRGLVGGCG